LDKEDYLNQDLQDEIIRRMINVTLTIYLKKRVELPIFHLYPFYPDSDNHTLLSFLTIIADASPTFFFWQKKKVAKKSCLSSAGRGF
jgi:hypothetical protein